MIFLILAVLSVMTLSVCTPVYIFTLTKSLVLKTEEDILIFNIVNGVTISYLYWFHTYYWEN